MSSQPGFSPPSPLIAEYSRRFRLVEIASIAVFAASFAALAARGAAAGTSVSVVSVGVMLLGGALVADFVSGLVHWAADTWGNQHWPIVGPTLIRSFREHHVDQTAITRHDFVEANGATALVLLPFVVAVHLFLPGSPAAWIARHELVTVFALSLSFCVLMTNQVHKWAHAERPPVIVRLLQRAGVLLTAAHHQRHHAGDHLSHYCITTGWLNPVMDRSGFFRMSEAAIQRVSPLRPREDDLRLLDDRRKGES
jgi:ubiquitin-conjugating enzyme E2 variant